MSKFLGDIEELKGAVSHCNLVGEWVEEAAQKKWIFRARTGEIINWWPSKGTLQYQGKNSGATEAQVTVLLDGARPAPMPNANANAKIFIVHGHDRDARDQLELVLMRLKLQPFILQNSDGGGKTLIEALEKHIYGDTAFGIILFTPDDFGYAKSDSDADRKPRARQNVILEMGMVIAALGRSRMAILQKGTLERPSDTDGIIRMEFNNRVQEIVPKLVQALQAAGIPVDANLIAGASA